MTPVLQESIPSKESVEAWLIKWIADALAMPLDAIETGKSLLDYSLSSVTATMLVGDVEDWLGLTLAPTLVWDYPSIDSIAEHLLETLNKERAAFTSKTTPAAGDARDGGLSSMDMTDAHQLLSNLDGLSDQDVSAVLNQLLADRQAGANPQATTPA